MIQWIVMKKYCVNLWLSIFEVSTFRILLRTGAKNLVELDLYCYQKSASVKIIEMKYVLNYLGTYVHYYSTPPLVNFAGKHVGLPIQIINCANKEHA